jgi:histidinol-phosphate aminotransferase
LAAAFLEQGIHIGRGFPALDDWARISIGLPEENARAQATLRKLLAG